MKEILQKLLNHEYLTREEMKTILIGITHSEYPTEQITALLTALQMRGVTVDVHKVRRLQDRQLYHRQFSL